MYLKLLDSIIAEEFQNDRRVYMQSEKKPIMENLWLISPFLLGVRSIKVGYQKAWESVLE